LRNDRLLAAFRHFCDGWPMTESIFEVQEAEEGGYSARALGFDIFTEAETATELHENVREATDCHFDETMDAPKLIRLKLDL
jgi:hypothetical protein